MEAEWKRMRSGGSRVWKGASQGGGQRGDKRKEGKREGIPYTWGVRPKQSIGFAPQTHNYLLISV